MKSNTFLILLCLLLGSCASNPNVEQNSDQAIRSNVIKQIDASDSLGFLFEAAAYAAVAYVQKLRDGGISPEAQSILDKATDSYEKYLSYDSQNIEIQGICGLSFPFSVEHLVDRDVKIIEATGKTKSVVIKVETGLDTAFKSSDPQDKYTKDGFRNCGTVTERRQPIGKILSVHTDRGVPIYSLRSMGWYKPYSELFGSN